MNVGFWQGNTYVKIHTPEVVAYHDNNEQLSLAPNLKILCPSKPFVRDNTEGICGLESIRPDTSCPAEATPHSQVEVTQAEIIGNQWLVNTPARTATLTYDQQDTATRIILPNQTLWITVPKGSILHIDELANLEISPFFKQHSFVLDSELEERIKEEGTQLIDLTPVDTPLEAIARLLPAGAPIIRSWSAADTALCISTIVGYVVTLTLTFLLHKQSDFAAIGIELLVRLARGKMPPRLSLVFPKVFFSVLSPMEFWFLAAVTSGLLSWGHFISSDIVDLIEQKLFELN